MNPVICDISFWQDNNSTPRGVDFAQMKAAGAAGVIIRAGQNRWADPDFAVNWKAAKEAGMPRGTYWFWDSRENPLRQADMWIRQLNGDFPELGTWMDFEEAYNGAYGTEAHMREYATRVMNILPNRVEVGVYTGPSWWRERVKLDPQFWVHFPLWIANYGVTTPTIPRPWNEWLLWQYTSSGDGKLYGVESKEIDLNYFNGDAKKMAQVFGLSEIPTEPTIPAPVPGNRRVVIEGNFTITEE